MKTAESSPFTGIDTIFLSKQSKDRVRLLLKLFKTSAVRKSPNLIMAINSLLRILNRNEHARDGFDKIT